MNFSKEVFLNYPVIGIIRGIEEQMVEPLCTVIKSAGLKFVEITMNTKAADTLIKKMNSLSEGRFCTGAGTVTNLDELHRALDVGARFIVMPVNVPEVVAYCVKSNIPVFPGALTPQEVFNAWQAGATMVKVFPAKAMGPGYMKELKAPLNNIELLACGGINAENVRNYIDNGASGVAFGAGIFSVERMQKGDYATIEMQLKELLLNMGKGFKE